MVAVVVVEVVACIYGCPVWLVYYLQYGSGRSQLVGRMAVEIVIVVAVVVVAGGSR